MPHHTEVVKHPVSVEALVVDKQPPHWDRFARTGNWVIAILDIVE
jgi:hypothetical protein